MSKTRKNKDDLTKGKPPADGRTGGRKPGTVAKPTARKPSQKKQTQPEVHHPVIITEPANTQTPSTETAMEVHHHPQLEHKHKPWKEYLLEGFMIFIAVMMGFIAENIRENITNGEHAEQLTSQLAQDLRADIKKLDQVYNGEIKIVKSNDTLISLLQQPLSSANTQRILWFVSRSHSLWPFHPATGAIFAIKNELHLKQFSNSKIIRYIATYENDTELLHLVQDITLQYQRSYFEPFLNQHFFAPAIDSVFQHLPATKAPTRDLTQDDLSKLAASMVLIRINTNELLDDNRQARNDAVELLHYIIKQYNLKD
ncbi:hypothetical protein [Mucilaginibacter flavidus]|uniref:hypothetical protein n=1 Tax=Mucilaginibacter flavidus TaxID=2949309 RepID=UPI002092D96E|nr:hypothetical protein [Mucilaginibacter flavidus]MCO5947919.1 hypothetical protein [Mucilaginibacter flavidus]